MIRVALEGTEAVQALHVSGSAGDFVFAPLPPLGPAAGTAFLVPAALADGTFAAEVDDELRALPQPDVSATPASPELARIGYAIHQQTINTQSGQIFDLRRRLDGATARAREALA